MPGTRCLQMDATWYDVAIGTNETTVEHGLERTPQEAFILYRDRPARVYRGSTTWNGTNIFLQASESVVVRLLIF